MNGPGHFANAESDLEHAAHASDKGRTDDVTYWLGCAQVHATLALTAATLIRGSMSLTPADWHEWQTAIDPEYAAEQAAEATVGQQPCRAHPDDCPNGPGPHAYYNPPEFEGRPPCCVQPGERSR